MDLLSSVSSNPDVIDKWIEVIDDLIRQVFKTCYKIDINQMPTVDTSNEQKRKFKNKKLYPSAAAVAPPSTAQPPTTISPSHLNQSLTITKPRSKTEIYSPPSFGSLNSQATANLTAAISPSNLSTKPTHHESLNNKSPSGTPVNPPPAQPNILSASHSVVNNNNNIQALPSKQRKFDFEQALL